MVSNEITLKEVVIKGGRWLTYLKGKLYYILVFLILGAGLGLLFASMKKTVFTAECSFVLEAGDGSAAVSPYSGLASVMGLNVGSSSGLFQGKNLFALYNSRLMIERTLLTDYEINGKKELLIDRYLRAKEIQTVFSQTKGEARNSLLKGAYSDIVNNSLTILSNDLIKIRVEFEDEIFAKVFVEKLVANVNRFYIQTRTKKSLESLHVLEKQADSVRRILNSSMRGAASAIDANPNANPALQVLKVASQRRQVDVQSVSAIYNTIVANIQASKMTLQRDTPLIQIVDVPVYPLDKLKPSIVKGGIIGASLGTFVSVVVLTFILLYKKVME